MKCSPCNKNITLLLHRNLCGSKQRYTQKLCIALCAPLRTRHHPPTPAHLPGSVTLDKGFTLTTLGAALQAQDTLQSVDPTTLTPLPGYLFPLHPA